MSADPSRGLVPGARPLHPCARPKGWAAQRTGFLCGLLLALVGTAAAEPAEVDPDPPEAGALRIVSLAPSVTETLFALGAADRLVGVSNQCDFPAAAKALPRVGSYMQPSVEKIIALRPDVVLGVPTPGNRAAVEQLRRLGVTVVIVSERTIADAWDTMETVGRWAGCPQRAEELVARLRSEIGAVARSARSVPPRRVLFVVGRDPLIAVGEGVFLDELLTLAGGENVARVGRGSWPRLSLEVVVASAPEVIIDGSMGTEGEGGEGAGRDPWWNRFSSVPAVRQGRIRGRPSDALLWPGPRLGLAARELYQLLHEDGSEAGGSAP